MPQPLTIISHIWNDSFLLPYFIRHYLPLCDRAVIVDYDSVDASRDIVKEMAPEWEFRQTCNRYYGAEANAAEIKEIEQEFSGWRFVANVTEFLIHEDLRAFLRDNEQPGGRQAIWSYDVRAFEHPSEIAIPVTDEPLYVQRRFGYHGADNRRGRMIHRADHGHFTCAGRHVSSLADQSKPDETLFVAWFCWAPIRFLWHRRLAASTMSPATDKANGLGVWQDGVWHRDFYRNQVAISYDLWERHPRYRQAIEAITGRSPADKT
jgi:hypothetical protein